MAHYALLDENNVVTNIIAGIDESELIEGKHPEVWYGEFHNQKCKRYSFNTHGGVHTMGKEPFRKNPAGIGGTYNEELDAFIGPKPSEEHILDLETCQWILPTK